MEAYVRDGPRYQDKNAKYLERISDRERALYDEVFGPWLPWNESSSRLV